MKNYEENHAEAISNRVVTRAAIELRYGKTSKSLTIVTSASEIHWCATARVNITAEVKFPYEAAVQTALLSWRNTKPLDFKWKYCIFKHRKRM